MSTYASTTDLQNAIGGAAALKWLTDPTNTAIDTNAVDSALDAATSTIDSYAAGTPGTGTTAGALWDSTPLQAKHACIALALYFLYERIRREEAPTSIKEQYDDTMERLRDLAAGKISWVTTEPAAEQNTGTVYYFGPGSTARDDNPRRTRRDQLDTL